jgi:hypothetical protein
MLATFKTLADLIGNQAEASRLIGVNKLRGHRLYHGAKHSIQEMQAIADQIAIAQKAKKRKA